MKKAAGFCILLSVGLHLVSQEYSPEVLYRGEISGKEGAVFFDTVKTIIEGATNIQGYVIPDLGPILGTGDIRLVGGTDTIYMMRCGKLAVVFPPIDGSNTIVITEALIPIHAPEVVGSADAFTVEIYSMHADSTPNTLLSSTATVSVADLADAKYYSAKIDQCDNVAGIPYLVLLSWEFTVDDEFGVMATNPGNNDGKGEMKTRLYVNDAIPGIPTGWQAAYNVFSNPSNFDADAAMMVIIEGGTGADAEIVSNGLSLHAGSVSLERKAATIRYAVEKSQNVTIAVFNLAGKTIMHTGVQHQNAGVHTCTVDLSGCAAGAYYYTVSTESASLTGKIGYSE
jgi:hypothetical protein